MQIIISIITFICGGFILTIIGLIISKVFIKKYKQRIKEEIYDLLFYIIKDALMETKQELRGRKNRKRKKQ